MSVDRSGQPQVTNLQTSTWLSQGVVTPVGPGGQGPHPNPFQGTQSQERGKSLTWERNIYL